MGLLDSLENQALGNVLGRRLQQLPSGVGPLTDDSKSARRFTGIGAIVSRQGQGRIGFVVGEFGRKLPDHCRPDSPGTRQRSSESSRREGRNISPDAAGSAIAQLLPIGR